MGDFRCFGIKARSVDRSRGAHVRLAPYTSTKDRQRGRRGEVVGLWRTEDAKEVMAIRIGSQTGSYTLAGYSQQQGQDVDDYQ